MQNEIRKQIGEIFNRIFECDDMLAILDKPLGECDINSLNFIKFIIAIEDEFMVEVDNQYLDINQYKTVGQMIETLEKIINKK